nr:helix-turn-helix domain-containing protein [Clostridia bacterium]
MLYQNLLIGENPYIIQLTSLNNFTEHRHTEIEIVYCLSGSLDVTVEKTVYKLQKGEFILVAPMAAHEYITASDPNRMTLVITVGPGLIRKHFEDFTKMIFVPPVKKLDDSSPNMHTLKALFEETAELLRSCEEYVDLLVVGNLHKICACILREYSSDKTQAGSNMREVANIEKALALIHDRYAEPITVDTAAEITGYGKSNFCKIFKKITGDTFHNMLNRRRVENAACYLDETALTVNEISENVGFADSKSFCRVFKSFYGTSPGQYRKRTVRD